MLASCRDGASQGYYGTVFDATDVPGTPRTPLQIHRRLLEDGYELQSPPLQAGTVYFANVMTVRGQPEMPRAPCIFRLILQRFSIGPKGLVAEIRNTPGPGFPGYPPVPDGRYAHLCDIVVPVVEQDPLVIPGLGPEPLRLRF